MIKNIIFDLGNVLNSFKPAQYFKKDFVDSERLCSYLFNDEIWNDYDQGIISKEYLYDQMKLRHPQDYEALAYILDHWIEVIQPIEIMCKHFITLSKQGYQTFVLSNVSEEGSKVMANQEISAYARGMVFSYALKINKPDPRIYTYLVENYDLKYEECLFLDDKKENVEAAIALGMQGIVVSDIEEAMKEMEDYLC